MDTRYITCEPELGLIWWNEKTPILVKYHDITISYKNEFKGISFNVSEILI
jgi:hypothetical protein